MGMKFIQIGENKWIGTFEATTAESEPIKQACEKLMISTQQLIDDSNCKDQFYDEAGLQDIDRWPIAIDFNFGITEPKVRFDESKLEKCKELITPIEKLISEFQKSVI